MQTQDIDYAADGAILRGFLALNESAGRVPGVLEFHEGLGLGDFAMEKARQLAALGYVALAADMFGERRQAQNLQEVATIVGGWPRFA
jgi:dienelactone hydrolase